MNYLQLVSRLRRRCRVIGADPTSFTNLPEEYQRLKDWINEAWMDIQTTREDWLWMRSSCSFTTVNGQAEYTAAQAGVTDLGFWARDTFRNYDTTVGVTSEILMAYTTYQDWRDTYQFGATRVAYSRPVEVTITPSLSLAFGPIAASGYTITGDYYRQPSEMVVTTDEPALPSQFHMLLVYRAMMYYGASESAPEVYEEGAAEFRKMLARLSAAQLTNVMMAGALA